VTGIFLKSAMAENGDETEQDYSFGDDSVVYGHDPGDSVEGEDASIGLGDGEGGEDPELEAIKARVKEMEEEAEKLKEMQSEVEKQMNLSNTSSNTSLTSPVNLSVEEKIEADARSIYVGNVDYGATAEELEAHFHGCGPINRVTILCDKYTGHPKGFAYLEFTDKDSVTTAMALDDSLFRGRQIKVGPKRTNRPGISSTNRRPRGSRFRGGMGRAAQQNFYYGYQPRGRGRGFSRGRRGSWFTPY